MTESVGQAAAAAFACELVGAGALAVPPIPGPVVVPLGTLLPVTLDPVPLDPVPPDDPVWVVEAQPANASPNTPATATAAACNRILEPP